MENAKSVSSTCSQNVMRNNHGYFGYFIRNPFNVLEGELRVICVM